MSTYSFIPTAAGSLDNLDNEHDSTPFYMEYRNSGNCSMLRASSLEIAREESASFARSFGDRVRFVRPATAQDIEDFDGRIYETGR
jgi:hypothetical protein